MCSSDLLLFWVVMFAFAVVDLLTGKPYGRLRAIILGGVCLPALGVVLLVVLAIHGLSAEDPPAWFAVLFCLGFVLGGIWHWWALTRPAVRQWFASSQAKVIPAEGGVTERWGKRGHRELDSNKWAAADLPAISVLRDITVLRRAGSRAERSATGAGTTEKVI